MKELKQLSNETITEWCEAGKLPKDIIFFDIREPGEYASEHIPGSINIPMSKIDGVDFSQYSDKVAVFYCRLGNRTQAVKDKLMSFSFKETYCLPQGIEQWKNCKLTTVKDNSAPMDIMRQVQITAGSFVLLGVVLGFFLSPSFYLLSAFFGAGLIYAGVSGTCMLGVLLSKMPWNHIKS